MFTEDSNVLNNTIKDIGYKFGLTAEQSFAIARHEFEYVRDVMMSADKERPSTVKSVNLMYFGKFQIYSRYKNRKLKEMEEENE